jgi:hypothetical protein
MFFRRVTRLVSLGLCARLSKLPLPPPLSLLRGVASALRPLGLLFKAVTTYAQLDINVDNLSSEYDNPFALTTSPLKYSTTAGGDAMAR